MKQPQKTSKMNEQQATNFCHQQPSLAVYLIIKSDREGKVASFTVSSSKGTFFFFFFNAVSLLPCCQSFHRLCKVYGLICPLVSSAAMPRSYTQVFHVLFLPLFPYEKVLSFKSILKSVQKQTVGLAVFKVTDLSHKDKNAFPSANLKLLAFN